jgi:hypothetical protein
MALAMSALTVAYLLIGYSPLVGMAVGLAIFGFFLGAEVDCLAYCTVRLFGRRAFGSIYGVLGLCMLHVGIGGGPVIFSATATRLQSYPTTFAIWSLIALAGGAVFLAVAGAPYLPTPGAEGSSSR